MSGDGNAAVAEPAKKNEDPGDFASRKWAAIHCQDDVGEKKWTDAARRAIDSGKTEVENVFDPDEQAEIDELLEKLNLQPSEDGRVV